MRDSKTNITPWVVEAFEEREEKDKEVGESQDLSRFIDLQNKSRTNLTTVWRGTRTGGTKTN